MDDRVLLAVTPATRARLEAALGGHQLVWVETFYQVRAEVERGHFDLVVIGDRFEESTSFDVLRFVTAASPASRIVCLRGVAPRSLLGKSSFQAFRSACAALGAALVLDLKDFPGDDAGNRAMRSLLEHQIPIST